MKKSDIKEGDVFKARWKDSPERDPYWCFEGTLVAKFDNDELWLVDTYWGINRWDNNKKWKYTEATKVFKLNYYVNLNELEGIEKYNVDEYSKEDVYTLSNQHACSDSCIYKFIKKGVKKNPQVKIDALYAEISEKEEEIKYLISSIKSKTTEIEKIRTNGL